MNNIILYNINDMDWISQFDQLTFSNEIETIKIKAHQAGHDLLLDLYQNSIKLSLITAESLTGGLIFSTLVDIPFGGIHKYGCICVYNSDFKKSLLEVKVDNIYSHKCAKEMAVGALLKSNASIVIAVTGNAMPLDDKKDHLGEVFIGIAGYTNNDTIKVSTNVYNFCHENTFNKNTKLINIIAHKINIPRVNLDNYNDLQLTSLMAQYIRYITVEQALNDCREFIKQNQLIIPIISNHNIKIICQDENISNDDGKIRKLLN